MTQANLSTTPPSVFSNFAELLIQWQQEQGRHDLPWQQDPNLYSVLVSEFMLQQTQVATVIPYYSRWMKQFPTLEALASADQDTVMAYWQGLGFYSRAKRLHAAAQWIVEHPALFTPETVSLDTLQQAPGIGPYTAGAIMSFAFNQFGPIVDGNVKRFYARLFGITEVISSSAATKKLWSYAYQLTPASGQHSRAFTQGLLDMGATLCKPKNPECELCPFQAQCYAYQHQMQGDLPVRPTKKVIPVREGHFLLLSDVLFSDRRSVYLEKRPADGIWPSLWCLPFYLLDEDKEPRLKELGKMERLQYLLEQQQITLHPTATIHSRHFQHTFSHYKLKATVWHLQHTDVVQQGLLEGDWVTQQELNNYALPSPIKKHLEQFLFNDEQD